MHRQTGSEMLIPESFLFTESENKTLRLQQTNQKFRKIKTAFTSVAVELHYSKIKAVLFTGVSRRRLFYFNPGTQTVSGITRRL